MTSTGPPWSRFQRWRAAAGNDSWPDDDTRYFWTSAMDPPYRRQCDSQVASQADEAICLFDEPSDIRWSHPLTAEAIQVVVGRPTGHRASLSDVDGHVVLPGLGDQFAHWGHTNALQVITDVCLRQLRCVSGQHNADSVTDLQ